MRNRTLSATLLLALTLVTTLNLSAQRTETMLKTWRFTRGDNTAYSSPTYDDRRWQTVAVPHDWAISGPFDREIDKQTVAIEQNGEREATEKTGRSGSLPWIGTGWYRTKVTIPAATQRALLCFDGAMAEPLVFVNGQKAGEWKYGYTPFNIDITPFLRTDGGENVIAVRLENVEESSRWYPGAGIYRPVTLVTTNATAIRQWSVNATTLRLNHDGTATTALTAEVTQQDTRPLEVIYTLQTDTRQLTRYTVPVAPDGTAETIQTVGRITPWTPERPNLYNLTATLCAVEPDGTRKTLDSVTRRIGFRTVSCTAQGGFQLNGVTRKIKGVCLHHDLGMLGAAVNRAALLRQLLLLKTMGCDAIRTAHNMPSQMQMDLCDSIGLMVMAESFDMWIYPKCRNGYARFFNDWAERDIRNLVLSNRHHPAVVMWSVGNEIPEQSSPEGPAILRRLQDLIHTLDRTRPITNGMDRGMAPVHTGFAHVSEVPGMNYRTHIYKQVFDSIGHGFILGSETASTVSSRGVYKFPVERHDGKAYPDGQCSSYDMEACWWSNIPEDDWLLQDDMPWVIGEFVWTGFDYLGEPTPYDEYWPSRSSYFGIFDLAGLPKDRYYLYRSRWNTDKPTIHILPHWTWPGREGETTPVYCYTDSPEAELFVNGVSQGRRTKRTDQTLTSPRDHRITSADDPAIDRYRLRWNDVKYEPGTLRVVCYNADGTVAGTQEIRTAGRPAALSITADEPLCTNPAAPLPALRADGDDIIFLTVSALDNQGTLCPDADQTVSVSVSGAATFRAICNGDPTSLEVFTKPTMRLFHGKLVVAIQARNTPGDITVTVKAKGMKKATVRLKAV
ncbi:MAG: DUF4982 domain-containing protein [Bacteroidales bacterium]|nr:DUF4982 domain-containing protein [Bacteroidales bacterium]